MAIRLQEVEHGRMLVITDGGDLNPNSVFFEVAGKCIEFEKKRFFDAMRVEFGFCRPLEDDCMEMLG